MIVTGPKTVHVEIFSFLLSSLRSSIDHVARKVYQEWWISTSIVKCKMGMTVNGLRNLSTDLWADLSWAKDLIAPVFKQATIVIWAIVCREFKFFYSFYAIHIYSISKRSLVYRDVTSWDMILHGSLNKSGRGFCITWYAGECTFVQWIDPKYAVVYITTFHEKDMWFQLRWSSMICPISISTVYYYSF